MGRLYDPYVHTVDCFAVSQELIRLLDVLEFVIDHKSYSPGSIMRDTIVLGKYNLRKRKVNTATQEFFHSSPFP